MKTHKVSGGRSPSNKSRYCQNCLWVYVMISVLLLDVQASSCCRSCYKQQQRTSAMSISPSLGFVKLTSSTTNRWVLMISGSSFEQQHSKPALSHGLMKLRTAIISKHHVLLHCVTVLLGQVTYSSVYHHSA